MTKGREKSDHRTIPRKGGNAPGGKAVTASKTAGQLSLFGETADSPQYDNQPGKLSWIRSVT